MTGAGAEYGVQVPKNRNTFSSPGAGPRGLGGRLRAWRRAAVTRAVHGGWRWVQNAGAVTAERSGTHRFGRIGTGTRLAFPQGTIFGEPWIHLGDYCIIGEQVTLTAGMMPGLDL